MRAGDGKLAAWLKYPPDLIHEFNEREARLTPVKRYLGDMLDDVAGERPDGAFVRQRPGVNVQVVDDIHPRQRLDIQPDITRLLIRSASYIKLDSALVLQQFIDTHHYRVKDGIGRIDVLVSR